MADDLTQGLGLDDDEMQRRARLGGQLGMSDSAVGPVIPPPQPAQPRIPAPSANEKTAPVTLRGVSPQAQQRTTDSENELARLQKTGSGISQIQNPTGRGILKTLDTIGSIAAPGLMRSIPGTELHHQGLIGQQRGMLGQNLGEEATEAGIGEKQATTAHTAEETAELPARAELERAQAAKAQSEVDAAGKPKPKEEDWSVIPNMVGPNGEVFQQEKNSGQVRPVSGMAGAHALKEPNEPERDKDIADYLQAHGLPDNPANREKARGAIANRGKQEPGTYMPLYDPKSGQIVGAWDPKSGHLINAPKLPGTTAAGMTEANKNDAQNSTANATIHSFTRYQQSFHDLAPKLSDQDRQALEVLTSHQDRIAEGFLGAAQSGVLDTLLGQPLTGYSQKLMGGAMTKDQFDKLSPAGKKMLTDYFNAVVQNFGNMKQIMGSVGRNPMQLLAEINTIPLPYLDAVTADGMFKDKLEDLKVRNPGINIAGPQSSGTGPKDLGPAPAGKTDGATGTLPDGTKVVVKGGRLVAQ